MRPSSRAKPVLSAKVMGKPSAWRCRTVPMKRDVSQDGSGSSAPGINPVAIPSPSTRSPTARRASPSRWCPVSNLVGARRCRARCPIVTPAAAESSAHRHRRRGPGRHRRWGPGCGSPGNWRQIGHSGAHRAGEAGQTFEGHFKFASSPLATVALVWSTLLLKSPTP